jgi:hypothetical protein
MDWFVSSDEEWAVVPFVNQYMVIYKGQQDEVFNTIQEARDYILKSRKKTKKGKQTAKRASKIKGLEEFMQ